ncbi:hypothetical protein [Mycolicibacterium sp.]|uniref:hypothetical protein n=1 Tax=Mycolicibacterium sp. TaxID=2320850 RepID=UPI003D0E5B91
MSTTQNIRKIIIGGLLSGGVALAALTAGTAGAAPANPNPSIDHSDYAGPVVECNQCGRSAVPGDGSVRINPGAKFGNGLLLPAVSN